MKGLLLLTLIILASSQFAEAASAEHIPPFSECGSFGLKPEVQQQIDEGSEIAAGYWRMGTECCSLTLKEEECKAHFENQAKSIAWQRQKPVLKMIASALLIIASIAYLTIFRKKVQDKFLRRLWMAMAIIIIFASIIVFVYSYADRFALVI